MIAKKVFENINFERGKDPKSSMNVGRFRDEITLTIHGIVSERTKDPITSEYDVRKYFQNLENGFFPSNIMMMENYPGQPTAYYFPEDLLDLGYKNVRYLDKIYKIG
jgi:hypothetical protein